jgi:hypothetical protein
MHSVKTTKENQKKKKGKKKGTAPEYTEASLISRTAALSTMFLTVNRLMALSFGTAREQFEQRRKVTCPRPFLFRPPFLLFLVCGEKHELLPSPDMQFNSRECHPCVACTIHPHFNYPRDTKRSKDTQRADLTTKSTHHAGC